MITKHGFVRVVLALCASVAGAQIAQAAGIDGAWANNVDVCDKVFVKKGDSISFAKDADLYGSGFIISGKRITGKMATCNITVRKEQGDLLNMVASCSTTIAIETVQLMFKIEGPDRLVRQFPGMPELASTYFRCPL